MRARAYRLTGLKMRSLYNGQRVNEYSCGTRQVKLSTSNALFAGIQFVDRGPILL
jgi:hypothetical protein